MDIKHNLSKLIILLYAHKIIAHKIVDYWYTLAISIIIIAATVTSIQLFTETTVLAMPVTTT